jgi:aryl-alcohol dehydrogenase-like predicted oxidoreductase
MDAMSRRTFMKRSALGASAFLAGCSSTGGPPRTPAAAGRVVLGRSGLSVPRVAMGTGTHGWKRVSDQTKLGRKAFTRLMMHGVERGAAFIDAADLYGSHAYVRHALEKGPIARERVTILSKIWVLEAPKMKPAEDALVEVERFLREMGVESIDICLIHSMEDAGWPEQQQQIRDGLSELKSQGIVRTVGCSCHTHAAIKRAADDPWTDVILARINPEHKKMDDDATTAEIAQTLKNARSNGKGVIGMKIFGCGDLTAPEKRRASLEYVLKNGLVDAMTIGFTKPEEIDDTMAMIDGVLAGL